MGARSCVGTGGTKVNAVPLSSSWSGWGQRQADIQWLYFVECKVAMKCQGSVWVSRLKGFNSAQGRVGKNSWWKDIWVGFWEMNRSLEGMQAEKNIVDGRTRMHTINTHVHRCVCGRLTWNLESESPGSSRSPTPPHLVILYVRSHSSYPGAVPVQVCPQRLLVWCRKGN